MDDGISGQEVRLFQEVTLLCDVAVVLPMSRHTQYDDTCTQFDDTSCFPWEANMPWAFSCVRRPILRLLSTALGQLGRNEVAQVIAGTAHATPMRCNLRFPREGFSSDRSSGSDLFAPSGLRFRE
jgi:hypothetical protein